MNLFLGINMKKNTIILFLLFSSVNLHLFAMRGRLLRSKPKAESYLITLLIINHLERCDGLMLKIEDNLLNRLNTIYDETLYRHNFTTRNLNETEIHSFHSQIQEEILSLNQDYLTEIHRFNENNLCFEDISDIIDTFKKNKKFTFIPDYHRLDSMRKLELHAMLSAMTHSLREIDEWIHGKNEAREDD